MYAYSATYANDSFFSSTLISLEQISPALNMILQRENIHTCSTWIRSASAAASCDLASATSRSPADSDCATDTRAS
eukprot:scaffold543628_cov31-Prasinocladus_malaysianus.AAC.1